MDSFLERVPVELYLLSVVACYNGAKPVVVDTKDLEVVRNIFGDLPMHHAFPSGKTDLFSGLAEAAKIAHPWQPRSTLLLMLSDGDTVPATGMPKMPASIADVLIVGVGDPRQGSFIDGRMSRQDASTLRQIAARLGGIYHDGNQKHISTATPESVDRHPAQERLRAAHAPGIRPDRLRARRLGAGALAGPLASLRHSLAAGRAALGAGERTQRRSSDPAWPSGMPGVTRNIATNVVSFHGGSGKLTVCLFRRSCRTDTWISLTF